MNWFLIQRAILAIVISSIGYKIACLIYPLIYKEGQQ